MGVHLGRPEGGFSERLKEIASEIEKGKYIQVTCEPEHGRLVKVPCRPALSLVGSCILSMQPQPPAGSKDARRRGSGLQGDEGRFYCPEKARISDNTKVTEKISVAA